jgi:hypothetical protein
MFCNCCHATNDILEQPTHLWLTLNSKIIYRCLLKVYYITLLEEFNYFESQKTASMSTIRHNWTKEEIIAIYNKPMMDVLWSSYHP